MSLNKSYKRGATRRCKSDEYDAYESELCYKINKHRRELRDFISHFDKFRHAISVDYFQFIPEKIFFTKEGYISERSGDTDNIVKVTQDIIFKNYLKTNDVFVTDPTPKKRPSKTGEFSLLIKLKILNLDEIIEHEFPY